VTLKDDLKEHPERFDLFRVLREFERTYANKPRIGDSSVLAQEIITIAQDPFMAFPDTDISGFDEAPNGTPRVFARFLGLFGPQGALPLTTTEEVFAWLWQRRDLSFPRFGDIFANRFRQLFFRAWADARPIAQYDRPKEDRFSAFVGSFAGIGSRAFQNRDDVNDIAKLPFSGLVASRIKSARRLGQLLRGVFGLDVHIRERLGTWLVFEPSDQMAVGARGSSLGTDTFLGLRSYSINDKFRISIRTRNLKEYEDLLPSGTMADHVADLVFFYVGHRYEYDVELARPARLAPPTRLGASGQLGWTSWVAPKPVPEDDETYLTDARFNLSERRMAARAAKAAKAARERKPMGQTQ
jgi:type VI secretion system protein ImpH